ncbi:MAG: hypothetical protein L0226_00880 [Acidobacteria bacterium]|nr:hypothetical protein [Acidobacteriota bacterium]
MTMEQGTRTPNERLAEIIADALVSAGLVSSSRLEDLKGKLAAGTAKPEDWRLWVESVPRDSQSEAQIRE